MFGNLVRIGSRNWICGMKGSSPSSCFYSRTFKLVDQSTQVNQIYPKRTLSSGKSTSKEEGDDEDEEPVKYTTSKAHTNWKSTNNYMDPDMDSYPPSQRRVVITSFFVFMIYFCILREENDIDEDLYKPLFVTQPQLEIPMIEASILEHSRLGYPTSDLENRLKELKKMQTLKATK